MTQGINRFESTEYPRENNMTPLNSQHGGGSSNKTPDTAGSTNADRPIKTIDETDPFISAFKRSGRA